MSNAERENPGAPTGHAPQDDQPAAGPTAQRHGTVRRLILPAAVVVALAGGGTAYALVSGSPAPQPARAAATPSPSDTSQHVSALPWAPASQQPPQAMPPVSRAPIGVPSVSTPGSPASTSRLVPVSTYRVTDNDYALELYTSEPVGAAGCAGLTPVLEQNASEVAVGLVRQTPHQGRICPMYLRDGAPPILAKLTAPLGHRPVVSIVTNQVLRPNTAAPGEVNPGGPMLSSSGSR